MKKLFSTTLFVAMTIIGAQRVSAQEIELGFEGEKEWWIQASAREAMSISGEQVATGSKALKFCCDDYGDANMFSVMTMKNKPINLAAGEYTISIMVYLEEKSPAGFNANFKNADGEFQAISLSLKNIEKGKWIEVTKDISLEEVANGVLNIAVNKSPKWGGVGTIYFDDIKITKR